MPITLKKDVWKVKDPSSGQYRGAAILSTTLPQDAAQIISESNTAIQNIKDTAIEAVDTALNDESTGLIPKAEADRDAIDDSLNNATDGIIPTAQSDRDDIDDSLNNIEDGIIPEAQANLATIAAAVQSQIGQGTDKTLSVAKGFADAKAAGMLVKVSDYQPGSALDDPATSQDASQNTGYPVYKDSNRVWVKETYAELEVPTMDDVDDLKSALDEILVSSPNLYNVETNTVGKYINSSGVEIDSPNSSISDYIELEPGDYWVSIDSGAIWGFGYIAYYNTDGSFDRSRGRPQLTNNIITISQTCLVRLMGSTNHVASAMLIKGTEAPSSYIPYYVEFNDDLIPDKYKTGGIDYSRIENVSIKIGDTNFVRQSSDNLINHMTIQYGKIISAYGSIIDTPAYNITDKIYLKPSTVYSYRDCYRVVFFNSSDERVGSEQLSERGQSYASGTFTTHANTVYAIVALQVSTPSITRQWQIVEGDILPDFTTQHLIIDGYRLYDEPDKPYDPIATMKAWDKTVVDTAPVYLREIDTTALSRSDLSVSAIYDRYDTLMAANQDYISKTALGDDGNGVTLYRYDFQTVEHTTGTTKGKTKLILISGVHPEWAGIYCLYNALERITNDPALIDIKAQTHLIVVPVVNAYACNGGAARKNHNGVDLARNFEVGWGIDTNPDSETYSGPYALSEVEDQYIDAIMAANTDAIYFASCHNFQRAEWQGTTMPNYNMWAAGDATYWANVGAKVVSKMSEAWKKKYGYSDDTFGTTTLDATYGSEGAQAMKYGIQGGTFEVSCFFNAAEDGVTYSASAISRGSEVYVNMVRTAMHCFDHRDKVYQLEA